MIIAKPANSPVNSCAVKLVLALFILNGMSPEFVRHSSAEPPVDLDALDKIDHWYCKSCRTTKVTIFMF